MQKMANLFLCSASFVCLQVFKPTIFMEVIILTTKSNCM